MKARIKRFLVIAVIVTLTVILGDHMMRSTMEQMIRWQLWVAIGLFAAFGYVIARIVLRAKR